MKTVRRKNITSRPGYFFNDMTNINDFDPILLNIDRVVFKNDELIMYDIKYIKNMDSLNTLYLVFDNVDTYIEENNRNKYLILASTKKNKLMLENYTELWNEIIEQIELINENENDNVVKYSKDIIKVKFEANDDLELSKITNIPVCVCVISSVFKEDSKYYPQTSLYECFYEYEEDKPLVLEYLCVYLLLVLFLEKIVNIIHKLLCMNVFMSMKKINH